MTNAERTMREALHEAALELEDHCEALLHVIERLPEDKERNLLPRYTRWYGNVTDAQRKAAFIVREITAALGGLVPPVEEKPRE